MSGLNWLSRPHMLSALQHAPSWWGRNPQAARGIAAHTGSPAEQGSSRPSDTQSGWRGMCRWLAESPAAAAKAALSSSTPLVLGNTLAQQGRDRATSDKGLEVRMESQVIFDSCWRRFEEKYRLQSVHVPREVVWLNGAPGAGKGVNTSHIMRTRGLETSVSLSQLLLTNTEAKAAIERGDMIPDTVVGDLLLEALLAICCKSAECGVMVDGFPRTTVQVDFLKLLYDKLNELHQLWAGTLHEPQFPRPLFKVVMLYVDEATSIKRQMERAEVAHLHNKRVMDAGMGEVWEQRATDISIEKCKKRYDTFKRHYDATMRLKQFFPFHLIDSMGTLEETQEAISMELRYQSSLDLSQQTYESIRHLPLARDVSQSARQQLVFRLDDHSMKHPLLFQKVVDLIASDIMPMLRESGMAGRAEYLSDLRLFNDHPRAAQMLIDVLTDRGFGTSHTTEVTHVPISIDMATGAIKNRKDTKHKFKIHWETKGVREAVKALEVATRIAETTSTRDSARISQSFVPAEQDGEKEHHAVEEASNTSMVVPVQWLGRQSNKIGDNTHPLGHHIDGVGEGSSANNSGTQRCGGHIPNTQLDSPVQVIQVPKGNAFGRTVGQCCSAGCEEKHIHVFI